MHASSGQRLSSYGHRHRLEYLAQSEVRTDLIPIHMDHMERL